MIKAIIFDCFGVLTTDAWLPFKAQYFGHDAALFERAGDLNKQSDGGFISSREFMDAIGDMAGVSGADVATAITSNVANSSLLDYAAQLKADYKIGLLSNAADDWLTNLFTAEQIALFDSIALSYETHYTKPFPEAYTTIADRLGESVGDCVFIDDQERFVTGAREAGMLAIWYKDTDQLKTELDRLLADSKH